MIIGEHDLSKEGDEVQRSNFSSVAIHYKYEEAVESDCDFAVGTLDKKVTGQKVC